jgi:hypothetical protein
MPAASDRFGSVADTFNGPCRNAEVVTPSDTADLANVSRYLWVGTGGNVVVITKGGQTVTLTSVPNGSLLPLCVSRVKSTSTTASNIVALN